MKFLEWLGSQSKLLNGAVVGWFIMGMCVGLILGVLIGIGGVG